MIQTCIICQEPNERFAMTSEKQSARERILETASLLFYEEGYHAVGIDTIIAEAGVAKMSLYRHFASKDELIVAYLERSNAAFWSWIESDLQGIDKPLERLLAFCDAVAQKANEPQCLGCAFQMTALEFPNLQHPAHKIAQAHKVAVLDYLRNLAEMAGLNEIEALAEELFLLIDGAWAASRMFGVGNAAKRLGRAARVLIAAHQG